MFWREISSVSLDQRPLWAQSRHSQSAWSSGKIAQMMQKELWYLGYHKVVTLGQFSYVTQLTNLHLCASLLLRNFFPLMSFCSNQCKQHFYFLAIFVLCNFSVWPVKFTYTDCTTIFEDLLDLFCKGNIGFLSKELQHRQPDNLNISKCFFIYTMLVLQKTLFTEVHIH